MQHTTTILAVISGKGGVGKSMLAVNLAEVLARDEHIVALVDADLGQSACPVLMNEQPDHTVFDYSRRGTTLDQTLHRTAGNLTLAVGARKRPRTDARETALFQSMDEVIERLRRTHEFIIIDAPAGMGPAVRWTLDRSNTGLLVVVGEPTAIADGYRLTRMIWEQEPDYPLQTMVNFTDSEAEARGISDRFAMITNRFTDRQPEYLGWIPYDSEIRQSVMKQHPAVREPGYVRGIFEELAETLTTGRRSLQETSSLTSRF
jgi:flagellar biosynthesis protein FlhG